ncbi:MAG: hypothetical protein HYZ40_18105 [Rhodospirillales bacterium]|nr:hypothetical protein [Rhodospirillales bacterium]
MTKAATFAVLALLTAVPCRAQTATPVVAAPAVTQTSSERVRDNPSSQYVLIKSVVGQAIGVVDVRALPVELEGYNLLRYCWVAANVLGGWSEHAGLTGAMVTRALEAHSWARDLPRAGYPEAAVGEVVGRYEAALVAASFTEAAREHALEALTGSLEELRRTATGAAKVFRTSRCSQEIRSIALNHKTAPEGGRARFIPYILHRVCIAQQFDPDDPVRCDYWMNADAGGPMSFAGEMIYSVRWPDGTTTTGRFNPDTSRSAGTVSLRQR